VLLSQGHERLEARNRLRRIEREHLEEVKLKRGSSADGG